MNSSRVYAVRRFLIAGIGIICLFETIHAEEIPAPIEQPPQAKWSHQLQIVPIDGSAWQADRDDVEKVLYSTARELWTYFPDRKLPPIVVQPKGGPIVLFQRSPAGQIRVRLNTGENFWSQYAYQFSHEFCHILCNYDADIHRNKWFEESLCELASIFTLRKMSETWKTDPPYPNWKSYGKALRKYSDNLIEKGQVPDQLTFTQWFKQTLPELSDTATDRPKNNIVAVQLLPLFEKSPEHWEAVTYLNQETHTKEHSFEDYLTIWHHNAPEKHRAFIKKIASEFSIVIEEKKTDEQSSELLQGRESR